MNIRFISYSWFLLHVKLVSASYTTGNLNDTNKTMNQIQGDVKIMIHFGHTN